MTEARPMTEDDDDRLTALVQRALELQDRGAAVDLHALCADAPELIDAVAEVLGLDAGFAALTAQRTPADPRVGRLLGARYRILAPVGRGAMGVVYRARDEQLGRDVAVKTFDAASGAATDPERIERFRREARTLAALRHPHIVVVHDQGTDDTGGEDALFVVMELLDGAALSTLLELRSAAGELGRDEAALLDAIATTLDTPRDALPERTWLRLLCHWLGDVASGLQAAHDAGVTHRDVKPSNVLIRRDGRAVLLDFGIAVRDSDPALTQAATPLGTPWYMAPEQARGAARAEAGVDVYALAATLYHLATGRAPYAGDGRHVVAQLLESDPPPPHAVAAGLPRDLCAVIEKGMERDPKRRYPSTAAFGADLRAFLEHRPTAARPLTRLGRAARRVRRHPTRYALLATTALVVLLLAIGVPLWRARARAAAAIERSDLLRQLPALLAIEGMPEQRLLEDLAERGETLAVLDRLLELGPDDHATRLWRAALRLDQGDAEGARADLDALVATAGDSPYLRAVAARYRASQTALRGTLAVDLAGLPPPQSAFDHFVAGFHELRNRHVAGFAARAEEHLRAAAAQGYLPAKDLHLIALLARGEDENRLEPFREAFELAAELKGIYGGHTARTAFARGTALLAMRRYQEALEPLELADALRPDRHGPLQNLGIVWRRLGEPEKALTFLQRAAALRPTFLNTQVSIGQVLMDLGRYDEALAVAAALPDDGRGNLAWRQPELVASIELQRAVDAPPGSEERIGHATRAREQLEAAQAAVPDERLRRSFALRAGMARSLAESGDFLASQLRQLRGDPDNPYQIANVELLLGETPLSEDARLHLRRWLLRLATQLAPGDTGLRQRLGERDRELTGQRPR
ncbi:MAG: protein kinase [Planctomycetes bacterium]|nr:protein kinase [Planctomycetota bacterium]